MHDSLLPFIDISFFVYTNDSDLKKLRLKANLIKKEYTSEYSNSISEKELKLYKSNVEPYKDKATYKLFLKNKWKYQIQYIQANF